MSKSDHITRFHACYPFVIALGLAAGCSTNEPSKLVSVDTQRLYVFEGNPNASGDLIYAGAVFLRDDKSNAKLFSYQRRVLESKSEIQAAHITRDTDDQVIVAESSWTGLDYALRRFEVINAQTGTAGVATVSDDGQRLDYESIYNGKKSVASERISDPLVCGPSLFGYVSSNWNQLVGGNPLAVRMIAIGEMKTYRFLIRHSGSDAGLTKFTITPTNLLVRLFVSPLIVTYASDTRHPVRYEGLIPPMIRQSGRLRSVNARVEYTMASDAYR